MIGAKFAVPASWLLVALLSACQGEGAVDTIQVTSQDNAWVGSWATAQYGPYPFTGLDPMFRYLPPQFQGMTTPTAFPDLQAVDQSFRMIVHPTLGGDRLRLRFSNLTGDRPVTLGPVRIALRTAGAMIDAAGDTPVLFGDQPALTIPPGKEGISDAVNFVVTPGDDLTISFHVPGESGPMTWHATSFDTQYIAKQNSGDVTGDVDGTSFTESSFGWFFVSGVDVWREDSPGAIVALGDSITDGMMEVPNSNTRWTDFFAARLAGAGVPMGVLNEGINGNMVFARPEQIHYRGEQAIVRFDRDVLERPGVRSLVLFEGSNDLSAGASAPEIFSPLMSLVDRARAAGLCVVVGTIMPRDDAVFLTWDRATMEPERQALNQMIYDAFAAGRFEGLADFSTLMGMPLDPTHPNPLLYFADLLHPNSLGFQLMADEVPLEALVPPPVGRCELTGMSIP